MSQRPLLVGEAPGRTGDPARPIGGSIGLKLVLWSGIKLTGAESTTGDYYAALCRYFEPVNLVQRYPGRRGVTSASGAGFPRDEAAAAWSALAPSLDGRVAVLLGGRVAAVAGIRRASWHEWTVLGSGLQVAAVQHPSGLARTYNDQAALDATGATLREAIRRAGSPLTSEEE